MNAAIVQSSGHPSTAVPSEGSQWAQELLAEARRFHRGEGRPVNYTEAIRLYRMAEAKGNPEAARTLALIYSKPLVNGGLDVTWMSHLSELDLSQAAPALRKHKATRQLQREQTPLIDYLPSKWRARIF